MTTFFFCFWKTGGGHEEIKSNQVREKNHERREGEDGRYCGLECLALETFALIFFTFCFDETNPLIFTLPLIEIFMTAQKKKSS